MNDSEKVEIPLSKGKLIKGLLGSIVFLAAGIWLVFYQPEVSNPVFNSPLVKYGAGIAGIIFSVFGIIFFSGKLTDSNPGLVIDENGILDNSSAVAAGFVPWTDIDHIATIKVMKQEFLMFIVKNPDDYLSRQTNILKRKSMEMNFKHYGSPISISGNGLKCTIEELKAIIDEKYIRFKVNTQLV